MQGPLCPRWALAWPKPYKTNKDVLGGSRSGPWLPVFCLTSCAKFLGPCTPSKPPRLHSACEMLSPCSRVALQVAIPAWVTQNYTPLSRSTCFHSSFILGWVVSFLHHWVFQWKSSFVCKQLLGAIFFKAKKIHKIMQTELIYMKNSGIKHSQ